MELNSMMRCRKVVTCLEDCEYIEYGGGGGGGGSGGDQDSYWNTGVLKR